MEETRKCQYCAEEIKVKAKLCKHCSKDLTTDEAISLKHRIEVEEAAKKRKEEKMKKKAEERKLLEEQRIQDEEKRKQNEQKRQKLILELSEKIDMYPEDMRKDIENDLSALKSLKEMDKEQIEKDISDKLKEEKKEAKKLLLIIVIAFLALTYIVTYFLFSTMLHHILFGVCLFGAVWSFPGKDESNISLQGLKTKLPFAKKYIIRSILTFLIICYFIYGMVGVQENYIEQKELQKQQEIERIQKNRLALQKKQEENTKISAKFSITEAVTSKDTLGIDLTLQDIRELIINNKTVDTLGKKYLQYNLELVLGENEIIIFGKNGNITKEVTHSIKRITEEEFQILEKERIEKEELERLRLEEERKSQLEREEKARIEAKRQAEIKKEEEENERIKEDHFWAWKGTHKKLEPLIVSGLRDPDSYEHINTTYRVVRPINGNGYVVVYMEYRAKNSFGGYVIETQEAYYSFDVEPVNLGEWKSY